MMQPSEVMINSPIAPSIWHFPRASFSYMIISIDKQKSWEAVHDYSKRVIELVQTRKMSEKYDSMFMCRIFLGGLREDIRDILIERKMLMNFKDAVFYAALLEFYLQFEVDDKNIYMDDNVSGAGASGPLFRRVRPRNEIPKLHIVQDGIAFYGELNARIDSIYLATGYLKILYR